MASWHRGGTRAISGYTRQILNGKVNPEANPHILKEGGAYVHIDGDNGLGLEEQLQSVFLPQPGDYYVSVAGAQNAAQFYELDLAAWVPVIVDIKPGSVPNSVNLKSKGVLPVAILGTEDFDVNDVDIDSLLFGDPLLIDNGGTAVSPLRSSLVDISGDGLLDLTLKFSTRD